MGSWREGWAGEWEAAQLACLQGGRAGGWETALGGRASGMFMGGSGRRVGSHGGLVAQVQTGEGATGRWGGTE